MYNLIEIIQGSNQPIRMFIQEEDCSILKTFNLTDAAEIKASFRNLDGTALVKLKTTSGIEVVSAPDGEIKIKLTSVDTLALKDGDMQSFQVEITMTSGEVYILIFDKVLNIKKKIF